jgi:uncharacterized membrane protein
MDKGRLEALSDNVFSIVMTLLIFDITVPVLHGVPSNGELLKQLTAYIPIFTSYFTSFAVLAMFWMSHNFFYSSFTTRINRTLVLLNMLYLCVLAAIPFSSRLLGQYDTLNVAVIAFGINVLAIGLVGTTVFHYAIYSDEIDISHVAPKLLTHARIRSLLTPFFAMLGIVVALFSVHAALFFFAFPIVFNMLPGTLDFTERMLGIEF